MRRSLVLTLLAVLVVILHGLLHGWSSGRWSRSGEPQASAARLAGVPLTVGEWQGEPMRLDRKRQAMADIEGYVLRRYVHRRRGTALSLLLVCGRHGPISVHTPDVCYRGAGFEMAAAQQRRQIADAAEFWHADFRRRGEAVNQLCILWAWNAGQGWLAPDHPRLTFGGVPALFKLYVVQETGAKSGRGDRDAGAEFLRLLLPVLDEVLFSR